MENKLDLLFIVLLSINVKNLSPYLPVVYLIIKFPKLLRFTVDINTILKLICIFLFSLSYSIIGYNHGFFSLSQSFYYLLSPFQYFLVGYLMLEYLNSDIEKIFFSYGISSSLFGSLSIFKTILDYGSLAKADPFYARRGAFSLWGEYIVATGMNSYLAAGTTFLPLFIFFKKTWNNLLYLFIGIISLVSVLALGNRMGIVIALISLVIVSAIKIYSIKKIKIRTLIFLFSIPFILFVLFQYDFLSIKSNLENSLAFERLIQLSFFDNSRFEAWMTTFFGLFSHPFGGKRIVLKLNYAHNLWLDVALISGIIPFLLLIIFTFFVLNDLFYFYRKYSNLQGKLLVILVMFSFLISFMVEPVLQGNANYFMLFLFLTGVLSKHNFLKKQQIYNLGDIYGTK